MTSSVTSWLGATKPDDEEADEKIEKKAEVDKKEEKTGNDEEAAAEESKAESAEEEVDVQQQIDELGQKAVSAAKEWGCKELSMLYMIHHFSEVCTLFPLAWLYGVGKTATTEVVKTAQTMKKTVEEKVTRKGLS